MAPMRGLGSVLGRSTLVPAAWVTLGVFVTSYLGIELTRESGRIASIWLANAVVLVPLLRTSNRAWAGWLLCGLAGNLAANLAAGDSNWIATILSLCNTIEVLLVAALYRWWEPEIHLDLTLLKSVLKFLVVGGLIGPATSAALAALVLHGRQGLPFGPVFRTWMAADTLGLLIIVPLLVAVPGLGSPKSARAFSRLELLAALVLVCLLTLFIIGGDHSAWIFLLSPLFLFATFRFEFAGIAFGIFVAAASGLLCLALGDSAGHVLGLRQEITFFQVFLFTNVLIFLPVASLLKALRAGEARFRLLFDQAPMGLAVVDSTSGTFLSANPRMGEILDCSPGQLMAHTFQDFTHPDHLSSDVASVRALASGAVQEVVKDKRYVLRSGKEVWAHLKMVSLPGKPPRHLALVEDITPRVVAQATLLKEKERYQGLFEHMHSGFILMEVLLDPAGEPVDHRLLEANAEFEAQTGLKREREVGRTSAELSFQWPADVAQAYYKVAMGGPPLNVERYNESLRKYYDIRAFSPRRGQWGMLFNDITQRKQVEQALLETQEKFAKIFNSAPILSALSEIATGRLLEVNERYCQTLGYTREELLGRTTLELGIMSPEDRARLVEVHVFGGRAKSVEFTMHAKGGQAIPCLFSGEKVEVGDQTLLLSMVADLTALKEAETDRTQLRTEVEHMQKLESLGRLASGVAHDMNNVLGAILALATAHLSIQAEDHATYPAFETIRDAALRGGDMVKRLLAFARQNPIERREVDLNALLLEEVRLLERTTLAKVHLELDLAPDLRPIHGDGSALAHAFMNLCVNAVDAMGEGGTLTFQTHNLDQQVEVVVADTGCGMTQEVMAKAMDPFFTTKEAGKGTGLGLSMVYTTVKAHGGQITLQSELGRSTTVRLTFPATATRDPAPPAQVQPLPSAPALRILLVDDDELVLKSTRMLMEVLGHTVTAATLGEEALDLVERGFRADVVILDMNMPGLGGKGTLPRLRARCPQVPVLLATGRTDQDALDLVAGYPSVTLLAKPFTIQELGEALRQVAVEPGGR